MALPDPLDPTKVPATNTGILPAAQTSANFQFAQPTVNATDVKMGPDSLVSENLNKLLSKDSPYMQLAKTKALQTMNARGLANSSMAVGAGQAAAIESSLPIAQGDASNYFTAARDNAQAANQFGLQKNQFGQDNSQLTYKGILDQESQTRDLTFRGNEADKTRSFTAGESALDRTFKSGESALDRGQQLTLQKNEMEFKTTADTTAFGRELERMGYANRLQNSNIPVQFGTQAAQQLQTAINAVLLDTTISPEAKQNAITNLVNYTNSQMDWADAFYGQSFTKFGGAGSGSAGTGTFTSPPPAGATTGANGVPEPSKPVGQLTDAELEAWRQWYLSQGRQQNYQWQSTGGDPSTDAGANGSAAAAADGDGTAGGVGAGNGPGGANW